jgi:hypothetical protein
MKPQTLAILAASAAALAAIAYFTTAAPKRAQPQSTDASAPDATQLEGTLLFPAAQARAADVAKVVIRKGSQTLSFNRLETPVAIGPKQTASWGVSEKDNYPALDDKLRTLVRGVLNARTIESKTSNPEWYTKLGVEDPTLTDPAPTGHLVTLLDASNQPIASLILGKKQDAANWDPAKAVTYVRIEGEVQSHAIRDSFIIATEPIDWIPRQPVELAGDRFHTVRIERPASQPIDIERPLPMVENYVLKQLPPGRRVADALPTRTTLVALASLSVEDVAKVETIDFANAITSTFSTFDGVLYTARTILKDGKGWTNITVAFDQSRLVPTTPAPAPGGDEAAATKAKEEAAALDARRTEDAAKEAAQLNTRLAKWAFQVPEALAKQLTPTLEDLLAPADGTSTQPTDQPRPPMMLPPG